VITCIGMEDYEPEPGRKISNPAKHIPESRSCMSCLDHANVTAL
jgi:hypothetical protein